MQAQRIGIGVIVAIVAVFALRVGSSSSQSVSFRDLSVWLPASSTGEVVLAHAGGGARGEIVARVKAAGAGEDLAVAQSGSGAVVLNRTKGDVGQIDGVTLTISQRAPIPGVDGSSKLLWSDAGARVVTVDAVHRLDRVSGVPVGSTPLREPLGGAVADAAGVVYGTGDGGQVFAVAAEAALVALPETARPAGLVTVSGTAYLVDSTGPMLRGLDGARTSSGNCLKGAIAAGSAVVTGGSSTADEQIAVVVDRAGGVRISDLRRDACTSVALNTPALAAFGSPVVAGGFVYLPVVSAGEVIVLNAVEGGLVRQYKLGLPAGRTFDLIEKDGTVWFNDPVGTNAGVLGRDGVTARIDKSESLAVGVVGQGTSGVRGAGGVNASGPTIANGATTTGADGTPATGASGRSGTNGGGIGASTGPPSATSGTATDSATDASSDATAAPAGPTERSGLVADFTYSARSVKVGQEVTFVDTSSGAPTAWTWEFADGTFATGPKVTHAWSDSGVYTVTLRVENVDAAATASVAITVTTEAGKIKPDADFRFNASRVEVGQPIVFTDRSTGDPTVWQWSFGDGSGGTGATVTHAYRAAGVYEVILTASNAEGSSTSAPARITVFDKVEQPTAVIGGGATAASVGQQVGFVSRSSGNPTQLQWSFGDGSTATGASVQHAWTKPGTYTVTLQVANSAGTSSATVTIAINEIALVPVSRFSVSQNVAEEGQPVRFQSLAINNPTQLAWEFGDGTTATGTAVTHAFSRAGAYTVSLRATNAAGSDVSSQQISVVAQLPAPVAAFSFSPSAVTTSVAVVFTDESSGGTAASWSWDFGDGSSPAAQRNPTHVFERVGTYVVRLTVANAKGSSTAQRTVNVLPAAPEPSFTFSPVAPLSGGTVQFTDTSGGGTAASWSWNFGDGSSPVAQRNPTHVFATNGSYDVRLTVTNASGSAFVVRRVDVSPAAPVAAFDFTPAAPTTATPVVFRNTSTGGAASTVRWEFGDSTPNSTALNPSHTYAAPGTYTVRLTMGNVTATSTATATVVVTVPPPVASFTASSPAVAGNAVTFTNTSTGGPFNSVSWDFGDGSAASTAANPTHVFATAGSYNVKLTVVNGGGSVSTTVRVTVVPPITAAFTVSTPRIALQAITFTNTTAGGPFTSLTWDFGDGTTATGATTTHSYAAAGTYNVTLRAVAATGATDVQITAITVAVQFPVAAYTYAAAPTPARTVNFDATTSAGVPFTTIAWDFGDGTTATGATVAHTFPAGASFNVKLTVTNATGTNSVTRTVSMVAPTAGYTFAAGAAARSVDFSSTSTGGPFGTISWNFGDGTTGTGAAPTHTFAAAGTYNVVLTVTNGLGASTTTQAVVIT